MVREVTLSCGPSHSYMSEFSLEEGHCLSRSLVLAVVLNCNEIGSRGLESFALCRHAGLFIQHEMVYYSYILVEIGSEIKIAQRDLKAFSYLDRQKHLPQVA